MDEITLSVHSFSSFSVVLNTKYWECPFALYKKRRTKKGASKCRCDGTDGRISMQRAEAVTRAIKNTVTQK